MEENLPNTKGDALQEAYKKVTAEKYKRDALIASNRNIKSRGIDA